MRPMNIGRPGLREWVSLSLIVLTASVVAARPQYGGVLRVEISAVLKSLDPAAAASDASDAIARARVLPLIFETLVSVDERGGIAPQLASSWEHDARSQRWRFRLRPGIRLHDGSLLDAPKAAAALRSIGGLKISADADTIVVEAERESPDLPWELASSRMAVVVHRGSDGVGTGPFRVERFESPRLVLRAHEDYWKGRPFVDGVEILTGQSQRDGTASVETGRADIAAIAPSDPSRLAPRGLRAVASKPIDLVALVFEEHRALPASQGLRQAVAGAIDRPSICSVVLQRWAQPATALLPDWLSGYAAIVGSVADAGTRTSARTLAAAVPPAQRTMALRVESVSPVDRAIADRIAVDAREAGLTIRVDSGDALAPRPDLRLVHIRLEPTSPDRALASALAALGPRTARLIPVDMSLPSGARLDDVFRLERALLEPRIIVPIVHMSEIYVLGSRLETWNSQPIRPSGVWDFGAVWMRTTKP
jgi:ABC-type transport system substrate-binding protein